MDKIILSDHNKTLTVNGVAYRVRYYTADTVVCDTDKLQGKHGDEFPRNQVELTIH